MRPNDLKGKQYGEWLVVAFAGKSVHGQRLWTCRCSCGAEKTMNAVKLRAEVGKPCRCNKGRVKDIPIYNGDRLVEIWPKVIRAGRVV